MRHGPGERREGRRRLQNSPHLEPAVLTNGTLGHEEPSCCPLMGSVCTAASPSPGRAGRRLTGQGSVEEACSGAAHPGCSQQRSAAHPTLLPRCRQGRAERMLRGQPGPV